MPAKSGVLAGGLGAEPAASGFPPPLRGSPLAAQPPGLRGLGGLGGVVPAHPAPLPPSWLAAQLLIPSLLYPEQLPLL